MPETCQWYKVKQDPRGEGRGGNDHIWVGEFILGPFLSSEGRKLLVNTLHQKSLNLALQGYPSLKIPPTKKAHSVES